MTTTSIATYKELPEFGELLDWYIDTEREIWDSQRHAKGPKENWRASSIGYCLRRQFKDRRGDPVLRQRDAKSLRTLKWGDNVHQFAKLVCYRLGLMIAEEMPLEAPKLHLTGHLDAILGGPPLKIEQENASRVERWSPEWTAFVRAMREKFIAEFGSDPMGPTGVEFKSTHSFAMKKIKQDGPRSGHVLQMASYALMARSLPDSVRPRSWRLVYIGKDAVGVLSYPLTAGAIAEVEDIVGRLNDAWKTKEEPPCTCGGSWERNYCPYPTELTSSKTLDCC